MEQILIIILLSLIVLILIVAIGLLMCLKQFEKSINANELQVDLPSIIKQYSIILNSLDEESSIVKLAKDNIAQIIFNDLESTKNVQEEQNQNGN